MSSEALLHMSFSPQNTPASHTDHAPIVIKIVEKFKVAHHVTNTAATLRGDLADLLPLYNLIQEELKPINYQVVLEEIYMEKNPSQSPHPFTHFL